MGLRGILGRKRKKEYSIPPDANPMSDIYHLTWERQKLPSPSAMDYAFESLALAPVSPISGAIRVRDFIIKPVNRVPQPYLQQRGLLIGIPTTQGQIFSQGLFNPNTGAFSGFGQPQQNVPFPRSEIAPAGAAT